jgi:hypothetical protein
VKQQHQVQRTRPQRWHLLLLCRELQAAILVWIATWDGGIPPPQQARRFPLLPQLTSFNTRLAPSTILLLH